MKRKVIIIFIIFMFTYLPCKKINGSCESAYFIEKETNQVLYEHNADEVLPMASTTKIMTAIIALEVGDLGKTLTVSDFASRTEGSSMYLRVGDRLTLYDAICGTLLLSGNDASVVVAEGVSGSVEDFTVLMNEKAKALGCENTSFMNPHGLDEDGHHTTARELCKIASYAMENEVFREIVSSKSMLLTVNGEKSTYYNKDKFLSLYEHSIGIKNGYTELAGRCFVSGATDCGYTVYGVVLNADHMYNNSIEITKNIYEKYEMVELARKGDYIGEIKVKETDLSYQLYYDEDVKVLKERGSADVYLKCELKKEVSLPVDYDEGVGKIIVTTDNEVLYEREITTNYSLQKKKSTFEKLIEIFKLCICEMF